MRNTRIFHWKIKLIFNNNKISIIPNLQKVKGIGAKFPFSGN